MHHYYHILYQDQILEQNIQKFLTINTLVIDRNNNKFSALYKFNSGEMEGILFENELVKVIKTLANEKSWSNLDYVNNKGHVHIEIDSGFDINNLDLLAGSIIEDKIEYDRVHDLSLSHINYMNEGNITYFNVEYFI